MWHHITMSWSVVQKDQVASRSHIVRADILKYDFFNNIYRMDDSFATKLSCDGTSL